MITFETPTTPYAFEELSQESSNDSKVAAVLHDNMMVLGVAVLLLRHIDVFVVVVVTLAYRCGLE
jgi:hypothetical protein